MPKRTSKRSAGPYKYIRRDFLNAPIETAHTSYVLAHVENSDNGREAHGSNVVYIADCYRVTQFDFYLGTPAARKASIAKINLLLEVLGEFGGALLREAQLIEKVEKEGGV